MKEISVVLPAYNEEETLETMVSEWLRYVDVVKRDFGYDIKIVVVNDGSSDKTREIGERLQSELENFTLVNHEVNKNLGNAVKTGIKFVTENRPESKFVCIMDCDNTQDPKYITEMLKKQAAVSADVVIASRYQKGAEIEGVPKYRLITSEGAKYVYSLMFGVKGVRDYTCGYRLYTVDILNKVIDRFGDAFIEEAGFTCMAELLYKLSKVGAKFAEIPFTLRYDKKMGDSKMKVFKTAADSFRLAAKLRKIK